MVNVLDKVQPKNKEQLKQLINYAFKHKQYDLNFIDTSEITDMSKLFKCIGHNFDVSKWDVSNVTNMTGMFAGCENFNCGLSNWDMSNVIDISFMFYGCQNFNCDLSDWDVSKVIDISYMFKDCKNFKGKGLDHWNLQSLIYSYCMFYGCDKNIIPSWYKSNV